MLNKKYILTVTLNPALDRFILEGKKELCLAGGKGINVSRGLKDLGVPTIATGFLGGKTGGLIKQYLNREGICHDFVDTSQETRINVTLINKARQPQRKIGDGKRIPRAFVRSFVQKYKQLLKNAAGVVLSGRNAKGVSDQIYFDLIRIAQQKRVSVFLDTSFKTLKRAIEAKPFLIKVNEEEFKDLFKIKSLNHKIILKSIDVLHKKGIKCLLISLGEKGVIGSSGHQAFLIVPPKVSSAYDVGCGDSMLAGFIDSFMKGEPFHNNLLTAACCGTQNASNLIPGKIDQRKLENIFKRCTIKNIR